MAKQITLYTVKEVAQLFRKSERTVYRWIEEGKLRAYLLGEGFSISRTNKTNVLIPEWALKEFIQINIPEGTIDKLKRHENILLETLKELQKEQNPKTLQESLTKIIDLILN